MSIADGAGRGLRRFHAAADRLKREIIPALRHGGDGLFCDDAADKRLFGFGHPGLLKHPQQHSRLYPETPGGNMDLSKIRAFIGEKTTIAGMAILASTATGWAAGQLNGAQAMMGIVGAVFMMVFRENLQTVLTSAGGPVNIERINTDTSTVNTTGGVVGSASPAAAPPLIIKP